MLSSTLRGVCQFFTAYSRHFMQTKLSSYNFNFMYLYEILNNFNLSHIFQRFITNSGWLFSVCFFRPFFNCGQPLLKANYLHPLNTFYFYSPINQKNMPVLYSIKSIRNKTLIIWFILPQFNVCYSLNAYQSGTSFTLLLLLCILQ